MQFQYGFSTTKNLVTDEWLYAWPKGRSQEWFVRSTSKSGEVKYKFGGKLTGDKEVWKRATRPNSLFLSTAMTLNSEQLKPIFEWFSKILHVGGIGGWGRDYSTVWCEGDRKKKIVEFMQSADFAIENLRITKKDFNLEMLSSDIHSDFKNLFAEKLSNAELAELYVSHQTNHGHTVELSLSDESDGTQKIFEFAAPWNDTLENGHVIVYDGLHEHLHPALHRYLINQFHDKKRNTQNAQLIFSTHDTSVLSQEILRRDQIWFCERNAKQETELFPLTDFSPRRGFENLERSYLGGRYGALPYLGILQKNLSV